MAEQQSKDYEIYQCPPARVGWGPFRYDWYSYCSMHRQAQDGCRQCAGGRYINITQWWLGHIVYKASPRLWRWWANRALQAAAAKAREER